VETVESSAHQRLREVEGLLREAKDEQPQPAGRERSEQPTAAKAEAPTDATRKQNGTQDTKPDRRGFEERSSRARDARELEIDGRASMSKDELIAALRHQRQPKDDADKAAARPQDSKIDRRPFAERSLEELRDRARELEIEGRSSMSKDELITALRQHTTK
jgi:hypothetical protein